LALVERAHLKERGDGLVTVTPLLERMAGHFADLLDDGPTQQEFAALRPKPSVVRSARRPFSIISKRASAAPFDRPSAVDQNGRFSNSGK
jgi:hypothetical protein